MHIYLIKRTIVHEITVKAESVEKAYETAYKMLEGDQNLWIKVQDYQQIREIGRRRNRQ